MRLPTRTELSKEQEEVFLKAPLDGATVIIGPPGTGKTVLAVYRAMLLDKQGHKYHIAMFNHVLKSYTGGAMREQQTHVSTWHSWMARWWHGGWGQMAPSVSKFNYNFPAMITQYCSSTPRNAAALDWGHLIIDEGQDFPSDFYLLCNIILTQPKSGIPSITVLVDENQRLEPTRNSTIQQIVEVLPNPKIFHLTINFRNTYEIAHLAEHFFAGGLAGIPIKPEARKGPRPTLYSFGTREAEIKSILSYASINDDEAIAVFVPTHKIKAQYYGALITLNQSKDISIQTYTGGAADIPDLEKPGTITIICYQSCKGLEFDAVFIPSLQLWRIDGAEATFTKMRFYVMATRSRKYLQYSYFNCAVPPPVTDLFPAPETNIIEWK